MPESHRFAGRRGGGICRGHSGYQQQQFLSFLRFMRSRRHLAPTVASISPYLARHEAEIQFAIQNAAHASGDFIRSFALRSSADPQAIASGAEANATVFHYKLVSWQARPLPQCH